MEGAASHLRYPFCFPFSREAAQQLLSALPSAASPRADTSGICLPSTSPYTMASFQTCFPQKIQPTSSFCICVHLPLPPCYFSSPCCTPGIPQTVEQCGAKRKLSRAPHLALEPGGEVIVSKVFLQKISVLKNVPQMDYYSHRQYKFQCCWQTEEACCRVLAESSRDGYSPCLQRETLPPAFQPQRITGTWIWLGWKRALASVLFGATEGFLLDVP